MHKRSAVLGGAVLLLVLMGCQVGCQGGSRSEATGQASQPVASGEGDPDPTNAARHAPVATWTAADDNVISTIWLGDDAKGTMYTALWRGAFPGVEDYVYAPADGDCTKTKATLRIDWDRAANTVHFLVKGKGFPVRPNIRRTAGTEWFPDPFHNAPKDFDNGAYRLWIILGSTTRTSHFWYDPTTLQLQGSDFDFPNGPPAGDIPVVFPVISITSSAEFDPDANGFAVHEWNAAYDHVTVESGTFARSWATFVPVDLCEAAPLQPGISQLRPYVSPWQPPDIAPTWTDMLHAGIGFDVQIDERTDPNDAFGGNLPYVFSGISYAGNMTAQQGGVPNGWANSILTAFQNVSPVIFPVPGGNGTSCSPYLHEPHVTAPRYCEGQH